MAKKAKTSKRDALLSPRMQLVVLPLLFIVGGAVVILTILSIILLPQTNPGAQKGVGANGFRAFIEENGDMGAKSIVTKEVVTEMLGKKAKSVSDGQVSKVFNLNGDRSQALTFPFVREDSKSATVYVDMKLYKNTQALDSDHIYVATAKAGEINGFPAYYKHAQTVDNMREYHIMVVNGLKAYRFVIAQPYQNITISEIDAAAILKKIATQSKL